MIPKIYKGITSKNHRYYYHYHRWTNMISRATKDNHPFNTRCYDSVGVSDEWLVFENFNNWITDQEKYKGYLFFKDLHLDKDILSIENKIYSPATCVFVLPKTNYFVKDLILCLKGETPGVTERKETGRFRARAYSNSGVRLNLGHFKTKEEAFRAWLRYKEEVACYILEKEEDYRVRKRFGEIFENIKRIRNI